MANKFQKVDYDKWHREIFLMQLLIAGFVFIIEVADNAILYVTRSQGYGPDTIVEKLIRYLLITTIINFGCILVGKIVTMRSKDIEMKKYTLILCTTIMCTDVSFSHYQFASTLVIFVIPILVSILYEDMALTLTATVFSLVGQTIAVVARMIDPGYNKDIGPEAIIVYSYTIGIYFVSKIIIKTLVNRRTELGKALIDVERANASVEMATYSFKMLETLARAIDAKDKYTNGHSQRVAAYATKLAEALGWDKEEVEKLKYEALLHDIGKIWVPDSVLNKPNRLTTEEFGVIKSHTLVGADILKDMIVAPNAYLVAKHHHERYDGNGYPRSIEGEEIPVNARIVCIADAYDAMNSNRIYRKALSREVIREELVKGRGTQFDPEFLDVFLQLFDEYKLNINVNEMKFSQMDSEQEYILEDIERVVRKMAEIEEKNNVLNDFDKFYKYMRNIGIRYNRSIEVLSISMIPIEDETNENEINEEEIEVAANALEVSIRKSIRAVDVYYRYSDTRHMVILLDAGKENIDIVTSRITYDFKLIDKYDLVYKVNEDISDIEELVQ